MKSKLGSTGQRIIRWLAICVAGFLAACAQTPSSAPTADAIFYPPLPQLPRIQYLTTIYNEDSLGEDARSGFRDFVVGDTERRKVDFLARPFALAQIEDSLYVLERRRMAVVRIDLQSGEFTTILDYRSGPLRNPTSIFVDNDWRLYIVDQQRKEVIVYNDRDEFEQSYSTGDGSQPVDVVVSNDKLFVSNLAQHDVIVLDKLTGEIIDTLGGLGAEDGLFNKPTNLALDADGNLAVVDTLNNRVQIIDQGGGFLNSFGAIGTGLGAFIRPKGLDITRDGYLYIADAAFEMVTIWELATNVPVLTFAMPDGGPASAYLPNDVLVDYDNVAYFRNFAHSDFALKYLIYVSNGLSSVHVFGFGEYSGPLRQPRRQRSDQGADDVKNRSNAPLGLEEITGNPETEESD